MRLVLGLLAAFTATPALAQVCVIEHAIYTQPGTAWELVFSPIPHDASTSQSNAFTLKVPLPDLDRTIEGAVYFPNGFAPNWGSMSVPCGETGTDTCKPWEGTAYALVEDGIVPLPKEGSSAPRQVLFPHFADGIWYSPYRQAVMGAVDLGDVFTFDRSAE